MINTVNKFKEQQSNSVKVLESLKIYLENGEKIGVDIDDSLIKKLNNAINDVETKKLKVALIGGFSEGKTSIAAAWIEKLDKSNMKISHQESSDEVLVYEVGNDIELIDTPGLFGFKEKFNSDMNAIEKYKDITEKYVSEAHLVLYVMNSINPIKDSHKDDLNWLFRTLNLLPRTVFVLSKFDEIVDVEDYKEKRDILYNHLTSLGFEIRKPEGTFYLFPKSPISDKEFTALALKHNILVVPGSGFGSPGYFRISYCVPTEKIMKSLDAWTNLAKEIFGK